MSADIPVTCRRWPDDPAGRQVVTDDGVVLAVAPDARLRGLRMLRPGQRVRARVERGIAGTSPVVVEMWLPGNANGSPGEAR